MTREGGKAAMKIGIYGGTFNPPHLGHLEAARTAVEVLGLDRLLLMPAGEPPHKELPPDTPAAEDRLAMARLTADALAMPGVVEVSDLELRRAGKSYTADTVARVAEDFPGAELFLLMGTDMFLSFHRWYHAPDIAQKAVLCAFGRAEGDVESLFAPQRERLTRELGARVVTFTLPGLVEVSSTRLRERLEAGKGGDDLLPAVYGYILMHRLYGTRADLKHLALPELRACSWSMVKAKRVPHIMGTEETAARLALRWGADETAARRAAILHDCTKYWTLEEDLALCEKCGVPLDPIERQTVKLLHAKTGACVAREVFGEPEDECEAIFWHTTGKAGMTTLEKVLYLADYMEPTRDFDGVEELRKLALEDLDRAVLLGFEMSIQEMREQGNEIHPRTVEGRDELRKKTAQR